MKHNAHAKPRRMGFTLVELLVVIAIVAVLASLLFSVFSGAKERARRTACQSNLKQLALAMQQYVQDNDGVYPPHIEKFNRNGIYGFGWSQAILSYLKGKEVFSCPEMPADAPWHAYKIGASNPDYNYNWGGLTVALPAFQKHKRNGARESILVTPSSTWLNWEMCWVSSDGELHKCRPYPKSSCGQEGGGSTLHSGGGNYSYVDGHVKWLTPEEAGEVECLNGPLPAPFKN